MNELIAVDLGSLVEDKKDRLKEKVYLAFLVFPAMLIISLLQRKWPEEKLPVGLESIRNFNVRAKVVGPSVNVDSFQPTFQTLIYYPGDRGRL